MIARESTHNNNLEHLAYGFISTFIGATLFNASIPHGVLVAFGLTCQTGWALVWGSQWG
jgi:hypothetical protein